MKNNNTSCIHYGCANCPKYKYGINVINDCIKNNKCPCLTCNQIYCDDNMATENTPLYVNSNIE